VKDWNLMGSVWMVMHQSTKIVKIYPSSSSHGLVKQEKCIIFGCPASITTCQGYRTSELFAPCIICLTWKHLRLWCLCFDIVKLPVVCLFVQPGYRNEMDRLDKLMDHLKEQERGYTGLLQTILVCWYSFSMPR